MSLQEEISDRVRRQYERYPYPDIDPQTQRPQMLVSGHLQLMCKVIWGRKKSPRGLRVLDAGCGTGSPLVAMALAYPDTHFTAVDFSENSLQKARQLAQRHQVQNVRFFHLPIQQLPQLGLTFDFVISSGVLHHLPEPHVGLKAIADVLHPQGAVSMMLYGKYGRTGIYMLQDALKALSQPHEPIEEIIPLARRLARDVPSNHPIKRRGPGRELQEGKDSGIVDLLLHANDIPFDVPAVYRLCRDAGMSFFKWLFPVLYNPRNYTHDPSLLNRFEALTLPQRHEIAELMHGRNSKHSFFAVGPDFTPPAADISNGKWRDTFAELTPCLAWNRTAKVPGENGMVVIPPAIVQDAWEPLKLSHWQLIFLSHIQPNIPMGEIVRVPAVRKVLPFNARAAIDRGVEKLLARVLDMMGIVLLGNSPEESQGGR